MNASLRMLAALFCALVLLLPLAGLFAEQHDCACGMSEDACFCEIVAAQTGAHCDMKGARPCSMRSAPASSGAALFVSLDLRGWLQVLSSQDGGPVLAPAGDFPLVQESAPRPFSRSPEPPPPRLVLSA